MYTKTASSKSIKKIDIQNQYVSSIESTLKFDNSETISIKELQPILLNKSIIYPERVYTRHFSKINYSIGSLASSVNFDMFIIPPGLLGIEYNKTHIFFTPFEDGQEKISSFVEVVEGELTVVMQKNIYKDGHVQCVDMLEVVKVSKGKKFAIPTGIFYVFVNTTSQDVVLNLITGIKFTKANYSQFTRERGLGVFVISKNAREEYVINPRYKISASAKLTARSVKEYSSLKHTLLEENSNLYTCLCNKSEQFGQSCN